MNLKNCEKKNKIKKKKNYDLEILEIDYNIFKLIKFIYIYIYIIKK